jgi:hypothetical protein
MTSTDLGTFVTADDQAARARREFAALIRLTERHAAGADRSRWREQEIPLDPLRAVRRTALVAVGTERCDEGEPDVDLADVAAALTLVEHARADLDAYESGLLQVARAGGLTWQQMAVALGVGSPQAARQRYERLTRRAAATDS